MKSLYLYILTGLILFGCFSCKEEDEILPNEPQTNFFAPVAGADDSTSRLRQSFYEETGCYLLFTDTLKNDYIGIDVYGNLLYDLELLDLTYGVNSTLQWYFAFTNLASYEQQKIAVDLVKKYILPVLGEANKPYSFLLVDKMESYAWQSEEYSNDGYWSGPFDQDYYMGVRAMALSVGSLKEEPESFAATIKNEMIQKYLQTVNLNEFYASGKAFYGGLCNIDSWYSDGEVWFYSKEDFVQQSGILGFNYYWDDDEWMYRIQVYSKTADLNVYLETVLGSKEEFMEQYGDYVLCVKKYEIIEQLLIDGGFLDR